MHTNTHLHVQACILGLLRPVLSQAVINLSLLYGGVQQEKVFLPVTSNPPRKYLASEEILQCVCVCVWAYSFVFILVGCQTDELFLAE